MTIEIGSYCLEKKDIKLKLENRDLTLELYWMYRALKLTKASGLCRPFCNPLISTLAWLIWTLGMKPGPVAAVFAPNPIPSVDEVVGNGVAASCTVGCVLEAGGLRKGLFVPVGAVPKPPGIVTLRRGAEGLNDWACGIDPSASKGAEVAGLELLGSWKCPDTRGACCDGCSGTADGGGERLYRARMLFLSTRPVICGVRCRGWDWEIGCGVNSRGCAADWWGESNWFVLVVIGSKGRYGEDCCCNSWKGKGAGVVFAGKPICFWNPNPAVDDEDCDDDCIGGTWGDIWLKKGLVDVVFSVRLETPSTPPPEVTTGGWKKGLWLPFGGWRDVPKICCEGVNVTGGVIDCW